MVIQRWQSVFLLLGAIAMGVFAFLSPASVVMPDGVAQWHALDTLPLFVLDCLVAVIGFIAIFLYSNLKLQKRVAMISMLLTLVSLALTVVAPGMATEGVSTVWTWPIGLPVVAAIFFGWARRRMAADERLLKGYDRLR